MPRNTCRSPSRLPRTRPALVRTTGVAAAARASGAAASTPIVAAPNNRRRRRSIGFRERYGIVHRPVLDQRRPGSHVFARDTAQPEPMTAAVEYMQFAAHARRAQRFVHHQRVLHRNAGVVGGVDQQVGGVVATHVEVRRITREIGFRHTRRSAAASPSPRAPSRRSWR